MKSKAQPAVFFDRDGVICEYVEELSRLEQFRLREGVAEAILKLNQAGYQVFVATNQPNIAKGKMSLAELLKIHNVMEEQIAATGGKIHQTYFCPHREGGVVQEYAYDCECRKPKAGMLLQAAQEHAIDISKSVMLGDTWRDVECARNFGIPCLGIEGGGGFPYAAGTSENDYKPLRLFKNPLAAVQWWLSEKR